MDATTSMLLFHPGAQGPLDTGTGVPLTRCRDRIAFLLDELSDAGERVGIPTPVFAEILVASGVEQQRIIQELYGAYAFKVLPFDDRAAIEVATLTDKDLRSGKKMDRTMTVAKVKYDRQIIAIAKVNAITTIYSDDGNLGACARANGLTVIGLADLPLPPEPPQAELALPDPAPAVD